MDIEPSDINLVNFLKKFTYQGDPNPGSKIELPVSNFLQIAALLRISIDIQKLLRR